MKNFKNSSKLKLLPYLCLIGVAFITGATPMFMNVSVDPYGIIKSRSTDSKSNELAEKAHYPLWKLSKYSAGAHDTIVLGDSRARSLRDKYWHELGATNALNLAYGGGTIPEIYETFKWIQNDPAIKNLVVGIQLRSFDENHKGGMNRVPEAINLVQNPWQYVTNWSVANTSKRVLATQYPKIANTLEQFTTIVTAAQAQNFGRPGSTRLETLLSPEVCFGCGFSVQLKPLPYSRKWFGYEGLNGHHRFGADIRYREYQSIVDAHYTFEKSKTELVGKFARQVVKNARSDWQNFKFSKRYMAMLVEIGDWANQNDKNLIFVIPPTIVDMQKTIKVHGLATLNHHLRVELSKFGNVVDLDFPSELTREISNFSDAYHFNSKVARMIVAEVYGFIEPQTNQTVWNKIRKRRDLIRCPSNATERKITLVSVNLELLKGKTCRLWKRKIQ